MFSIDADNNITAHGPDFEAAAANGQIFSTPKELKAIIESSPGARALEIWNSLPGVTPVSKFTNRAIAAERIWKRIQGLAPVVQEPQAAPAPPSSGDDVATEPAGGAAEQGEDEMKKTKKKATRATAAKRPTSATAKAPREGSKQETILGLLKQRGGATLAELMKASGWQAHSVRGFISGHVGKKMGISVTSTKNAAGERTYAI